VPGHCGIFGNEEADKLAKEASAKQLLVPEPALGIPRCLTREATKNWTEYQHYSTWKYLPRQRHGKLFIGKPCKKRADDLLKLSRHLLRLTVAIFMEHAPVRGHLYIIGLFDGNPTCRFCRKETETVHHIMCCCEVPAHQRYNVFGNLTVAPKEISTTSVKDLCLIFLGVTGILDL
jgi:hypothetical protein